MDDLLWQDRIDTLPDGRLMLVADIKAMLEGEPFRVFPRIGVPFERHEPLDVAEAHRLIEFYVRSKRWGLPSGRGWAGETEYCMKVLMHLDETQDRIDSWRIERPGRK